MSWNTDAPDGTKSVKANNDILQANTTYTETEMNKDHFWNIGADEDGHHKFAQMPKYTDGAVATPTSPTLDTGMDLAFFSRLKTAVEATVAQDVQAYVRNAGAIMQLLGIRACCVFNNVAGNVAQSIVYKHNITSVTRQTTGRYSVVYADALPTDNYLIFGGGMKETANDVFEMFIGGISSGAAVAARKNTLGMIFLTGTPAGVLTNALQSWFVVFGG